jgi:hypothetical protein
MSLILLIVADCLQFLQVVYTMGLNVLENIFSKTECYSEASVKKIFQKAKDAKKSGKSDKTEEKYLDELRKMYGTLLATPKPERLMLTSTVIQLIDKEYIDKLAGKSQYIGTRHTGYGTALAEYHLSVKKILAVVVENFKNDTETHQEVAKNMMGKLQLYMTRVEGFELIRFPLMTPSALMSIADVWTRYSYAIREVSHDPAPSHS